MSFGDYAFSDGVVCSPEKDHVKQIRAFATLFSVHPELFVPERKVDATTATAATTAGTDIEAGTKEPASVEQSGWLHVDSSRPPSPSKSKAVEPSSIAGSTDAGNSGENNKSGVKGEREEESETLKLVLLGSARHQEDLARVEELRSLARELGIEVRVSSPFFQGFKVDYLIPHLLSTHHSTTASRRVPIERTV
jgi:hypothetical protein